jgi:hypothetical protein
MMIDIDFKKQYPDATLFAGRKNGQRAREIIMTAKSELDKADKKIAFHCSEEQLITSSYFLGLLEEYLVQFETIEDVFEHINLSDLNNPASLNECKRAIRRGAATNGGLF